MAVGHRIPVDGGDAHLVRDVTLGQSQVDESLSDRVDKLLPNDGLAFRKQGADPEYSLSIHDSYAACWQCPKEGHTKY